MPGFVKCRGERKRLARAIVEHEDSGFIEINEVCVWRTTCKRFNDEPQPLQEWLAAPFQDTMCPEYVAEPLGWMELPRLVYDECTGWEQIDESGRVVDRGRAGESKPAVVPEN